MGSRKSRNREYDIIWMCRLPVLAFITSVAVPTASAQGLDGVLNQLLDEQIDEQVQSQIESQVQSAVESAVESSVSTAVESAIEQQVEAGVADSVEQGVEALDTGLGIGGIGIGGIVEPLTQTAQDLIETLTAGSRGSPAFVGDVDPGNRAIEADVWVVMVPSQFSDRIDGWGFTVLERRDLASLNRVLLRVEASEDRDIAQAALDLALDAPGTVVDYNHVYQSTLDGDSAVPADAVQAGQAVGSGAAGGAPFTIGIVDSIVDPSHPALAGLTVEQQDFVPFGNARTVAHGTAVASIIAGSAADPSAYARLDKLRAASVFFRDSDGAVRATTAGLIAAVDWLASAPGIGVINMSLAGPPNKLLEVALGEVAADGIVIVAAVGNGGPTAEPLYPAAYDSVVGVTAVDSSNRIYRYANRGRQVMFSALGVQVRVASPSGGFNAESGTSLASPLVAELVAESMAGESQSSAEAIENLQATALDLGARDYDEIYGFGLVRRSR